MRAATRAANSTTTSPTTSASTATTSASAPTSRRTCRGVIPTDRSSPQALRCRSTCRLRLPETTKTDVNPDTSADRTSSPMIPFSSSSAPALTTSRPLPLTNITAMTTATNEPAKPVALVRTLFQASTSVIDAYPGAC